uniref:Uncharacterized protein n=1 Tax=Syphacia muris TaxID=451379 RepID=A0A0N5AR26_9BILA
MMTTSGEVILAVVKRVAENYNDYARKFFVKEILVRRNAKERRVFDVVDDDVVYDDDGGDGDDDDDDVGGGCGGGGDVDDDDGIGEGCRSAFVLKL